MAASTRRIASLDVLRGFALCGILLVNVQPIAVSSGTVPMSTTTADGGTDWLGLLAEQRFFPIFSLLFGIGFSLLLRSASVRVRRPRLLLARRLVVLLGVGVLHHLFLWSGDILAIYAVVGLVVLLPSSWLPRGVVIVLSIALLVAGFTVYGGGPSLVPGLFLLGSILTRYGVVDRLEQPGRALPILGVMLCAAGLSTLWWQLHTPVPGLCLGLAGLFTAGTYCCAILLLLRTPLRRALRTIFVPLGRMALTNYLTATVLVLATGHVIGRPGSWSLGTISAICGAVLLLQWAWSTVWLARFRQGPLEWLWRWATWARRPPLTRETCG